MFLFKHCAVAVAFIVTVELAGCEDGTTNAPATIEVMPPSAPPTAIGTSSGSGKLNLVNWGPDPANPGRKKIVEDKDVDFSPHFAYAYTMLQGDERTLWLVVSDRAPDTTVLDNTDDRAFALQRWCNDKGAMYSAVQVDSHGVPILAKTCAGNGARSSSALSAKNVMGERAKVTLSVNDGKRVEGQLITGAGFRGTEENYAKTTGDFHFAADVAPPTLRDRVLAEGKEDASGIPGAKSAFLDFWRAQSTAKTFVDLKDRFTPEHLWQVNLEEKIFYPGTPKIKSAKANGAAAVIGSKFEYEKATLNCQTLLLQLDGKWKMGKEDCVATEQ